MLEVTITTSQKTTTFMLDLPITDKIELHYHECSYCDKTPVRLESIRPNNRENHRFCSGSHRVSFTQKRIAAALTA